MSLGSDMEGEEHGDDVEERQLHKLFMKCIPKMVILIKTQKRLACLKEVGILIAKVLVGKLKTKTTRKRC